MDDHIYGKMVDEHWGMRIEVNFCGYYYNR